ncbi:MAG: hypothetical protein HY290_31645 [Planctomycetia bacterium]|nr:hypothetical protein [Planctomycetia bacterium]
MPRPKKDPALVKSTMIKIPLTADQKELIVQAAASAESEMTAWARQKLVDAAREEAAKSLKAHGNNKAKR